MPYIYLASPYTHEDSAVRQVRYERVRALTALLLRRGLVVFSPIIHHHDLINVYDLPKDAAFWGAYDTAMMRSAQEFWVHTQPGWRESVGVAAEIELAGQIHLPIGYVEQIGDDTYRLSKQAPVS